MICWFIAFLLLGTYAYYTDDYEPYVELVDKAYITPFAYFHIEQFWIVLMEYFRGDIDGFRFISMILLSISLVLIMIRSKVNPIYFISFYTILCLNTHVCWVRQPLAYCLILLALVYYSERKFAKTVIAFCFWDLLCMFISHLFFFYVFFPFVYISYKEKEYSEIRSSIPYAFCFFKSSFYTRSSIGD